MGIKIHSVGGRADSLGHVDQEWNQMCFFFSHSRPLSLFPGQVKREAVGEFVESFWFLWPTVTSNSSSFYHLRALIPSGWPLHSSFELMREDSQWVFHQLIAKTGKWRHSFLEMPWVFHTANLVQGTVLYSKVRPFWSFLFFCDWVLFKMKRMWY